MPLKLDGTYGISGVVGTASSAAVSGSDPDSGIVFGTNETTIIAGGVGVGTFSASGLISNVTGNVTGNINASGVSTLTTLNVGTGGTVITTTTTGLVGIGTINPTSHLSVRGTIESLTDTNDPNSSTEGGQLIVRAPINQAGTKYRYNIDNYYGTSGGQPSATSNFRIFREDDSTTANGVVLFNIDSFGRVTAPSHPRANWVISCNTSTFVRTVSIKRDAGGNVSSVPAGNGSSHGSVGRFTAPVNGTYLITIRGAGSAPSGSNEVLSVYGSWSTTTNVLNPTNEVLDLRVTPLINDGIGWASTLYLNANDYWELDWYRPASTTYVGTTFWDISTVLLG